jgi:hypothetical protein
MADPHPRAKGMRERLSRSRERHRENAREILGLRQKYKAQSRCERRIISSAGLWAGRTIGQHSGDPVDHAFEIIEHFVVPKADDLETLVRQIDGAGSVLVCLEGVLVAVEFDYQRSFEAAKVGDKRTDGMLAAELDSELTPAQAMPEELLEYGGVASKAACASGGVGVHRVRQR